MMKSKTEEALEQFKQGYNCAQSILTTYGKDYGLDRTTALKVATGFGAGMGRQLDTCGMLTGAYMVIGMKHSMTHPDEKKSREASIILIRKLTKEFSEKHGDHRCGGLTGYSALNTEEDIQKFGNDPARAEICRSCLRTVASFLETNL
ncbi:C-GCAxxG-C-C family protein [Bacteroidota bacterium]